MTGEITLSGLVLPIGGIREKALAARRHGIKTVILPQGNKQDLVELPEEVRKRHDLRAGARRSRTCCRVALPGAVARHADVARRRRRRRRNRRRRRRGCRDGTELIATVAFYISGHGFGHASRQIEIINAFARGSPDVAHLHAHAAARWLLERTIDRARSSSTTGRATPASSRSTACISTRAATIARGRAFYATFDARAADEAALLRDARRRASSSPTRRRSAARRRARAGIPSVVVSNFTWDWIYADYAEHLRVGART